jgi:hypothetical protein
VDVVRQHDVRAAGGLAGGDGGEEVLFGGDVVALPVVGVDVVVGLGGGG